MCKLQLNESDQCWNIAGLSFAKGACLDLAERQPLRSNNYESNYWWHHIVNGQYSKMSVNRVSMIFGSVSMVIEKLFGCYYA